MHFAKKIGCIALLILYLQVTCAWHIRDTKKSRREIETNWQKDDKGLNIKKDGKTKYKVVEENRTSVADARQKHM